MCEAKLLIKYHSAASLFVHVFILILGLHVLPGKYALLELEVDAILAQNFREQMALNLVNVVKNCVAEYEISLVGRVGVQI